MSETTVNALARRTSRLIEMIETATQRSTEKTVREGGAQLVELLTERLEEIREMHAGEDDDLVDRVRGFELRVRLAEAKVLEWPQQQKPRVKPRRSVKTAA
jgi:hypothetical protein